MKQLSLVLPLLVAALLTAQPPSPKNRPAPSIAYQRAAIIAGFLTDPYFDRAIPDTGMPQRLRPLAPAPALDLDGGTATATNPEAGIISLTINFAPSPSHPKSHSITDLLLILDASDPQGTPLLPVLKSQLKARLPKTTWSCFTDGQSILWRKRHTHQIIHINSGSGSSLTITAGKEVGGDEGDSSTAHPCR